MRNEVTSAYEEASAFLVDQIRRVDADAWQRTGLGEWSILDLIGHANRAHTLVVEYLERPVDTAALPAGYFTDAAVAARGRASVAELGDDPLAAVERSAQRTISVVRSAADDCVIGATAGTMPLVDYLPSRIAELVIHALDIAAAIDEFPTPPPLAGRIALQCLAAMAVRRDCAGEVLRALSGRAPLPDGFSLF